MSPVIISTKQTRKLAMNSYEKISFLPHVIAQCVCEQPYAMQEHSLFNRNQIEIDKVETLRKAMTLEQIREFSLLCDSRCRAAYAIRAPWFMKCVRSKGNRGRDQMYVWIRHWMVAFLRDAPSSRDTMNHPNPKEPHAHSNQT
jgi:hypothetical protein